MPIGLVNKESGLLSEREHPHAKNRSDWVSQQDAPIGITCDQRLVAADQHPNFLFKVVSMEPKTLIS